MRFNPLRRCPKVSYQPSHSLTCPSSGSEIQRVGSQSSSASCGVTYPMALCRRSVLYQSTHFNVSHSTWLTNFQGPRKLITSVLNRPMMLSARALS